MNPTDGHTIGGLRRQLGVNAARGRMPILSRTELERLSVVLVGTRNPLNIGAAARAMSNFGFRRLRVVNPYEVAFREARSAVGAAALLATAEEFESVAAAVADCTLVVGTTSVGRRQLQHAVRSLQDGAKLIRGRLRRSEVALLFGSEKVGLSNADLSHCHWLMRIPTREQHRSMNLGQAVAVCLYELVRGSKAAPPQERTVPATAGEVDRIAEVLLDALRFSGFFSSRCPPLTEDKLRRLTRRLRLSRSDAAVWLGMLRQIVWKLRE